MDIALFKKISEEVDNELKAESEMNKEKIRYLIFKSGKTMSDISMELYGCRTSVANLVARNRTDKILSRRTIMVLCKYFGVSYDEFNSIDDKHLKSMYEDKKKTERERINKEIARLKAKLKDL